MKEGHIKKIIMLQTCLKEVRECRIILIGYKPTLFLLWLSNLLILKNKIPFAGWTLGKIHSKMNCKQIFIDMELFFELVLFKLLPLYTRFIEWKSFSILLKKIIIQEREKFKRYKYCNALKDVCIFVLQMFLDLA